MRTPERHFSIDYPLGDGNTGFLPYTHPRSANQIDEGGHIQLPPLKQVMETVSAGRFLLHKLRDEDLSCFAKFIVFLPVWVYCMFSQLLGLKLVKTAMQRFLHKEQEIYTTWMKAKEHKA